MKKVAMLLFAAGMLLAQVLKPVQETHIKAAVLDMVAEGGKIYVATDASKVMVFDSDLKLLQTLSVRKVKDFLGTLNDADVYSVDVLGGAILYLAQAEDGYAELYVYKEGKARKVLDKSAKLYAKAAKFVDAHRAVIALMSDEVVLYDLDKQKIIKRAKAGEYFYSAMAIDPARKFVAIGDEGGEVIVLDAATLQRIKLFKDVNKDKILTLAATEHLVAAGSRADKVLALYSLRGTKPKTYQNPNFFIYVTALSPDERWVLFGDNEKYILKIADTDTLGVHYELAGHHNIVNVARFLDAKTIISGSETGEIIKWRLP